MWLCVCVYDLCDCVYVRIYVYDFERENHKFEICVWFVILKGKIINLKVVFVICVSEFGTGMTRRGPWGPTGLDGVGLGWKNNPFIKQARFGHRKTCPKPDPLPFLSTLFDFSYSPNPTLRYNFLKRKLFALARMMQ